MSAFAYTALDATGRQTSGSIDAESRAAALDRVMELGLSPLQVEEKTTAAAAKTAAYEAKPASIRLKSAAVESFTWPDSVST